MRNLGSKLADPKTNKKTHWKTFNKVMNKGKSSRIPPLLINNKFIINCKEKPTNSPIIFLNNAEL